MEVEEAIIAWFYYKKKYRKRERRVWVRPNLEDRFTRSLYVTLYPKLRDNETEFFEYFKMSIKSFDNLLQLIHNDIKAEKIAIRYCISPEERLIITLRYLATGCSMSELHSSYKIGKSTVCSIIHQVCEVVWTKLKNSVMPAPNKQKWIEISKRFEQLSKFPHCIGAVSGKLIKLMKSKQKSQNEHSSLVLFALCDADYLFSFIDVEAYEKDSDSGFFKYSNLHKQLIDESLDIPKPVAVTNKCETVMPYVIVGNEAFGLMKNLMRPYGSHALNKEKKIFNHRLKLAHKYIECTLAILCNKWGILNRPLGVSVDYAKQVVKAITVLHNYVRIRDGYNHEDTLQSNLTRISSTFQGRGTITASKVRTKFTEYFVSEGRIEGQDQIV